MSLKNKK